jgi:type IV secretory pathway VirB2 component (pilin)
MENIMLTNFELNRDFYWRLLTLMCVSCMVFIVAESAFATASQDVIGITMCRVTASLSGGIAKSIASIAIFVVGVGLFMGKVNWSVALMTAAGVIMIFSSSAIIGFITGGTGASNACSAVG